MKAAAYQYAEGDTGRGLPPVPYEIALLSYIDRFGARAVTGRETLAAGEIKRMLMAEQIVSAYQSRKASNKWAEWENANPYKSALLKAVEKELHGNGE